MTLLTDDLGATVSLAHVPRRVVSLVPSLTEAIASVDRGLLVGATQWCTHPGDLDVARVRGTKNPDQAAIRALTPDLVIANHEENRRIDVERLRADGIPVWVTHIESLEEAFASLRRLFTVLLAAAEPDWLSAAEAQWAKPAPYDLRAAIMIWRNPWMAVGAPTFAADLIARLGMRNVFGDRGRYPRVELDDVAAAGADLVLLPDEPYSFSATDGPEAFPPRLTRLVSGRLLTWYGPSLIEARTALTQSLAASQLA